MQRSLIAEIFGYLVCLLAVVIFFMSVAGIVNNAFRVVHPTGGPRLVVRRFGGPGPGGQAFFRARGGPGMPGPHMRVNPGGPMLPAPGTTAMRAPFEGNARYDAARRLVLAIVMLVVSILVFRRAFEWLNGPSLPRSTP